MKELEGTALVGTYVCVLTERLFIWLVRRLIYTSQRAQGFFSKE